MKKIKNFIKDIDFKMVFDSVLIFAMLITFIYGMIVGFVTVQLKFPIFILDAANENFILLIVNCFLSVLIYGLMVLIFFCLAFVSLCLSGITVLLKRKSEIENHSSDSDEEVYHGESDTQE